MTCTGGRPEAFALCERWMARQTIPWQQWIVVDDCLPATPTMLCQERIEPRPAWQPGQVTLGRNLKAALERVTGDAVAVIEDDDWYGPMYLAELSKDLDEAPLVGEGLARYYNVRERGYIEHVNARHASLCSTMWRHEQITPHVINVIENSREPFYDLAIWRTTDDFVLTLTGRDIIGIKGMPGRGGIGSGHNRGSCRNPDHDLTKLREWIGDDADFYESYRR